MGTEWRSRFNRVVPVKSKVKSGVGRASLNREGCSTRLLTLGWCIKMLPNKYKLLTTPAVYPKSNFIVWTHIHLISYPILKFRLYVPFCLTKTNIIHNFHFTLFLVFLFLNPGIQNGLIYQRKQHLQDLIYVHNSAVDNDYIM